MPAMVEELLRWETPVMGGAGSRPATPRSSGFAISEGEQVMVAVGAANVDEAEFADAGERRSGTGRSTGTWPSAAASTAASGHTWPASSFASR